MRYEKGHKDATRSRIIDIASKRFRSEGIDAVGVASMMADAGLTHGGFYSHFASKEDLVVVSLAEALDRGQTALAKAADQGGVKGLIRLYMHAQHRDHPEAGCAAAALASEIARHPPETRVVMTDKIDERIDLIEQHLRPASSPEARRRCAIAIFATMMGALQLSRLAADTALSESILAAGTEAAEKLADAL